MLTSRGVAAERVLRSPNSSAVVEITESRGISHVEVGDAQDRGAAVGRARTQCEVVERLAALRRDEPLESYRCRVCRRGRMELVVGEEADAASPGRADHVVVARCCACARESRVAWSRGRPSEQEVTLDLLYGRR